MNSLTVFQFEGIEVRFVGTPEKPEWVASDVCAILGIDTSIAVNGRKRTNSQGIVVVNDGLGKDEKGTSLVSTPGGMQEMLTVTEPGLYRLIFKSRKPVAKRFQHWVYHEVLPIIRKTGKYELKTQPLPDIQNTLTLLNALLDPLTTKGVDIALIQSAKMSAVALQHPEYQSMLNAAALELTLLTPDEDRRYNPTRLGEFYATRHQLQKPVPPRLINIALEKAGFQVPEYRTNSKGKQVFDWKLTSAGEQYGKMFLSSVQGNSKTLSVIRWLPSVLDVIEIVQGQKDH